MVRLLPAALVTATLLLPATAHAQWDILDTHSTADLRGVSAPAPGIVWISGTNGTVLRSEDAGYLWQHCATPPNAEHLDFRGIQAFDANTAIVMSSGKGNLSRLYKTTDGCQTWILLFTNPDPEGFWDSVTAHIVGPADQPTCSSSTQAVTGSILGDPAVHKSNAHDHVKIPSFYLATFTINSSCTADKLNASASAIFSGPGEASFAASNSVLFQPEPGIFWLATDRELIQYESDSSFPNGYVLVKLCGIVFHLQRAKPSQGVFSFAVRPGSVKRPNPFKINIRPDFRRADIVAVGGDYEHPDDSTTTAALTAGSNQFQLAKTMPHGYRSSVAYSAPTDTWITVGPNGTDISTDDGRNWHPLHPTPGQPSDADRNWNALALPFVVGPHGRVGILNPAALKPTPASR